MSRQLLKRTYTAIREDFVNALRVRNKQKIFCIGRNKTGTTSLKAAFERLGYVVGNQHRAELLLDDYIRGDFDSLVKYCSTAQVFQDFPFSYPGTFKVLDKAFPGSKFILSMRDDAEQWYNSFTRYHTNTFGRGKLPTAQQLKNSRYIYKGWVWKAMEYLYKVAEENPYEKEALVRCYAEHNRDVLNYFDGRLDDLLVINLAGKEAYQKFCSFLGTNDSTYTEFPWENKSTTVK